MKRFIIAALALACSACGPSSGDIGSVAVVSGQVALKATTGLALGELAYNSAEAAATATIKSGHLSAATSAQLGEYVHAARGYRDQARSLVAAGQDASAVLESLSGALAAIHAITG